MASVLGVAGGVGEVLQFELDAAHLRDCCRVSEPTPARHASRPCIPAKQETRKRIYLVQEFALSCIGFRGVKKDNDDSKALQGLRPYLELDRHDR